MKKTITLAVCVMLLALLMTPVLAAGTTQVTITPENTAPGRGDTVVFTVSIAGDNAFKSLGLELEYNTSVFEMVSAKIVDGFGDFSTDGSLALIYTSATAPTGTIAKFTMRVKADAVFGTYTVGGALVIKNGSTVVSSSLTAASVKVNCSHSYDNACDNTCNLCGATRTIQHSYSGKVTTAATCTSTGVKTYTCTVCGESYTEIISKTDHTYDKGKVTTEATCTSEGVKTYTCTGCGVTKTEAIAKKDHSYDKGKVTTEATCTEDGVKTYTCTSCSDTKTETVKATGHSYDNDCDPDCNTCGDVRETEHDYSPRWNYDAEGHWHQCTICGDMLEVFPHTPGPEATETSDQICTECGYVIEPAGQHTHSAVGDWLCDEDSHWLECACGERFDEAAHIWSEETLDEEQNAMVRYCTQCGYSVSTPLETDPIPTETTSQPTEPGQNKPTTPGTNAQEPDDGGEFPWWIVVVAVGAVLIGGIVFVIVGILKGQKQNGKYSN